MIRAVTFDYWRTLLWEPQGELQRCRLDLWEQALADAGQAVDRDRLVAAHDVAFREASLCWKANRQFRAEHAAAAMLDALELAPPEPLRTQLADAFTTGGLATPLKTTANLRRVLQDLRDRGVRIGIVCDVGLTPSPVLREHLERRGLLEFFDHWSFSDEVGVYKPDPEIFRHALEGLRVAAYEAAHVGDMRRTDVVGARRAGLAAVRYAGVFDDADDPESPDEDADVVITDHRELVPWLEQAGSGASRPR